MAQLEQEVARLTQESADERARLDMQLSRVEADRQSVLDELAQVEAQREAMARQVDELTKERAAAIVAANDALNDRQDALAHARREVDAVAASSAGVASVAGDVSDVATSEEHHSVVSKDDSAKISAWRRRALLPVLTVVIVASGVGWWWLQTDSATKHEPLTRPVAVVSEIPTPPRPSPTPTPIPTSEPAAEPESEPAPAPAPAPARPQPQQTRQPAPAPAQHPAPEPQPQPAPAPAGHVTNLVAAGSVRGDNASFTATVTTSGPVTVNMSVTIGGRSVPMGSQQVNGQATFTGSISGLPPGTHEWVASAGGLSTSGTLTVR
ncbi:hypothetical protein [Trueperella pyogenes]|uniref:Ig-like domain-containing protein n=2 Tax=Trueperella pyogenes TaxID=1661 RepID=UPI003DA7B81E